MSYVDWLQRSTDEAGLHWLSDEVRALLWVQMRARDRLVQRMREAVRAADSATADEYALALIGSERNLQRMPGESLETWRAYIMAALEVWRDAGKYNNLVRQLERLELGEVALYEWGESDPSRWAEFSVYIAIVAPPTAIRWGDDDGVWEDDGRWARDNTPLISVWGEDGALWGDDGVWGWDGDPDVIRALVSLIEKWKPARSRHASLTLSKGALWGVDDGLWQNDGTWQVMPEMHTITF